MNDYIVRATAADDNIRIFAITSKDIVETARTKHKTTNVATAALGRLLTAGALMGSMMKNKEDILTLQINCAGPAAGLTVTSVLSDEVNEQGEKTESVHVKGYIKNPNVDLPLNSKGKLDVGGALGAGFLTVIKDMGLKEPFSGQTELISGEIAEDLTYYFANSEQVPSAVALGVLVNADGSVKQAGGFIVQLLPFATEDVIDKLEKRINEMPSVTTLLNDSKTPEDILESLFADMGLNITDRIPAAFKCNCNKDRVSRAISSISRSDIQSMIDDGESIEVKCHFCDTSYVFSVEELKKMITDKKIMRNK